MKTINCPVCGEENEKEKGEEVWTTCSSCMNQFSQLFEDEEPLSGCCWGNIENGLCAECKEHVC